MQGKSQPEARSAHAMYVGIDVCKTRLDVHLHPIGRRLCVTNDGDGIKRLRRELDQYPVARVVMEATAKYHRLAHRQLSQAGLPVAVVNPLRARLFAQALGTRAKTDRIDAAMLAILGNRMTPQATPPPCQALEALQELVHARHAATAERTALANRLATSHTPFLKRELARRLKTVDRHIQRLATQIDRHIAGNPDLARRHAILLSIPSVGPAVAAALIADMPELGHLNRHAIACLAGLAPFADDSGQANGPRHIKGGRPHPRRALYWAALTAARHNPDMADFYKRLTKNGKKPKVALTAVMRKLVVLANTLLKENRQWTPIRP